MRNIDKVLSVIENNPQGLDDDEISEMTKISPRQQIYQICSRLASQGRIERRSVEKDGKRKKIHNFPAGSEVAEIGRTTADFSSAVGKSWERRLSALEAATALSRDEILDRALADLALKVLAEGLGGDLAES